MSVNYTPIRGDYKDLTPFRFWCQKILPLVYDDSLSYYELLCKVVDYLNKTMEDVDTLEGDVTGIYNAYNSLQEYVNDYFDNLNVQDEIDNKLDRLVADGTIHDIFNDDVVAILNQGVEARNAAIAAIPSNVTSWLNEHITQETGYVIDDTLSIQGAAADAKATGDAVSDLKSDFNTVLPATILTNSIITNTGYYIGRDGDAHVNVNFGYSDFLPSVEGMKYIIKAPTYSNTGSAISFYADNNFNSFIKGVSLESGDTDVSIIAPKFTKYIVVCYDTRRTFNIFAELINREIYTADVYKNDLFNEGIVTNSDFTEPGFISLEGEITSQNNWFHTNMINIPSYADKITVMRSRAITSGNLVAFYTKPIFSASSYISGYSNDTAINDDAPLIINIPNGAKFAAFSTGPTSNENNEKPCAFISSVKMYKNKNVNNVFSVLSDSYSAYPGWIPEGSESFYPTNSQTVKDFKKMWWYLLAEELNMQPLIIDGYSGATISTNVRPEHDVSVSFVNRMKKSMGEERTLSPKPSIIFILGGQNDVATNTTIGEVQYSNWTDNDLQQFAPAFCYMLDYLIRYNPGCKIINITNTGGVSSGMATAMETACEHYNITNIILHDISKTNAHPTAMGMLEICRQVIAAL